MVLIYNACHSNITNKGYILYMHYMYTLAALKFILHIYIYYIDAIATQNKTKLYSLHNCFHRRTIIYKVVSTMVRAIIMLMAVCCMCVCLLVKRTHKCVNVNK